VETRRVWSRLGVGKWALRACEVLYAARLQAKKNLRERSREAAGLGVLRNCSYFTSNQLLHASRFHRPHPAQITPSCSSPGALPRSLSHDTRQTNGIGVLPPLPLFSPPLRHLEPRDRPSFCQGIPNTRTCTTSKAVHRPK
jgi:hypothetical protein